MMKISEIEAYISDIDRPSMVHPSGNMRKTLAIIRQLLAERREMVREICNAHIGRHAASRHAAIGYKICPYCTEAREMDRK